MEEISYLCGILIAIIGALYSYRAIYIIVGLFKTKKFKPAKKKHRYAILIPARNEETVIGNLLDSISRQDYPSDLIEVFVVADNCTDGTARIAKEYGAHCYERHDKRKQTKGFALQFLFERIDRDFGIGSFDGYYVFDADNLLKRDYISKMNDAFDSGEKVVTSYRNTKNFDDNIISAGYAIHWLRTALCENKARSYFGLSTRIQGCGFLFSSELVKDGWKYTTLAEDRAFTIDVISEGICVGYQHEAEFYDEQPTDLKIALRQRKRWAKGHLEAFRDYWKKLLVGVIRMKDVRRKIDCFDAFMTTFPLVLFLIPIKIVNYVAVCSETIKYGVADEEIVEMIVDLFEILIFEHFGVIPMALLVFLFEYKHIARIKLHKVILYSLTFPLFGIIGDLSTWVALFNKIKWDPIPHKSNVKIAELE